MLLAVRPFVALTDNSTSRSSTSSTVRSRSAVDRNGLLHAVQDGVFGGRLVELLGVTGVLPVVGPRCDEVVGHASEDLAVDLGLKKGAGGQNKMRPSKSLGMTDARCAPQSRSKCRTRTFRSEDPVDREGRSRVWAGPYCNAAGRARSGQLRQRTRVRRGELTARGDACLLSFLSGKWAAPSPPRPPSGRRRHPLGTCPCSP